MSEVAIQVLKDEIELLKRLSIQTGKKKSVFTKQYATERQQVEAEINQLLHRSGIFQEHEALLKKKAHLKKNLDSVLSEIDTKIQQAMDIAAYLQSRVEALEIALRDTENSQ